MGIFIFMFGLIIGSFLNVCIYRLPREASIAFPASHCTSCNHTLGPLDLVPVFSYLFLRGKCRYCGAKVSWRYSFVEGLTGILFTLMYIRYGCQWHLINSLWFTSLLIIVIFIDLDHHLILNKITYLGIITGLAYNIVGGMQTLQNSLLGFVAGGGLFLVIALVSRGGMGGGDVKLAAMLGVFLGWQDVLLSFFFAFIFGALVGLILIVTKIKSRKDYIPFGPFMVLGALIVILAKEPILNWYLGLWM